jgi:hypothetical protein
MSDISPENEFLIKLGEMVLAFNRTERRLRDMLAGIVTSTSLNGRSITIAKIVTAELGGVGLTSALSSFANNVGDDPLGGLVNHAADYFDKVREYRNYYVHGIQTVIPTDKGGAGFGSTESAKSKLKIHRGFVRQSEIEELTSHCETLTVYVNAVINCLADRFGQNHAPEGFDLYKPQLPDKPPSPARLVKPQWHLKEFVLLPPASPE